MHAINLTSSPVTLYSADTPDVTDDPGVGVVASWEVAGPTARSTETRRAAGALSLRTPDGEIVRAPLDEVGSGEIVGLPDPTGEVTYIVSRATAERATGRLYGNL
ncbi:hypothetical protein Aph01nite_35800 [Acrocarpospora phusangensis]|uniref:Uncharacterized protein n=1 Tax=Acrocarpospora phusangensis TaxID=1070424 RepID=A0A919QEX2_9ACTN|nr:hypothetical protein [Acrocarpospora phusangensis]GIH25270.1 hypothetical protein Aph01nite_35800 [Acrocarpospora phusangensis]